MTALHFAAKMGDLAATETLLRGGRLNARRAINVQDEGGWTPLVWASENAHPRVAKWVEITFFFFQTG